MPPFMRDEVSCNCMGEENCKENSMVEFLDGTSLPSIPYLSEDDPHKGEWPDNEPCHDCGCLPGKFHHPGCDMEICPRCKEQAIQCKCLNNLRAQERLEKKEERRSWAEATKGLRAQVRDRWQRILKQDPEYRRLIRQGYTFFCGLSLPPSLTLTQWYERESIKAKAFPALLRAKNFNFDAIDPLSKVDPQYFGLPRKIAQKRITLDDLVQCPTAYDEHGTLMPDAISLWVKVPKIVVQKSEQIFTYRRNEGSSLEERERFGMTDGSIRARWTVWYEGHEHIKGYGLTKKDAIEDLEEYTERALSPKD